MATSTPTTALAAGERAPLLASLIDTAHEPSSRRGVLTALVASTAAAMVILAGTGAPSADEIDQLADLGDGPTPATLDLHSPEHDAEMSVWFEAEFADRETAITDTVSGLPERVPRAA